MFFSAGCSQTSTKATGEQRRTDGLNHHHPDIGNSGSNAGLGGGGAAAERTDVYICSLSGSLPREARRLPAALDLAPLETSSGLGQHTGGPGCAAERLQLWAPKEGASCTVTGALRGDSQWRKLRKGHP